MKNIHSVILLYFDLLCILLELKSSVFDCGLVNLVSAEMRSTSSFFFTAVVNMNKTCVCRLIGKKTLKH